MRQSLKVTLSLLVSLLIFSAFALISFTSLFDFLETSLFQPRITKEKQKQLEILTEKIESYHQDNIERFGPILKEQFVSSAFLSQQSQEDIFKRINTFGKLLEEYKNLEVVRFLDQDGEKIHFSTSSGDIKAQEKFSVAYHTLEQAEGNTLPGSVLVSTRGEESKLILHGKRERFIYSFPIVDRYDIYRGTALFYLFKNDLSAHLMRIPGLDFKQLFIIDKLGVVINFPENQKQLINDTIAEIWENQTENRTSSEPIIFETPGGEKERYRLISIATEQYGFVGVLIHFSVFELQPIMKAVLLSSFFFTVFLIVFLIFNIKQDPLVVLSQRIKRFQIGVLQEFIEGKERVDWEKWRKELVSSRAELRSRIKKGVGKIPSNKEAELDGMIDKSWDEIISIIETRLGEPKRDKVDLSHVEALIQQALDRGKITLTSGARITDEGTAIPSPGGEAETAKVVVKGREKPAGGARKGIVVEEIGVEEVVEVSEVGEVEEVEEIEEAEEVAEVGEVEEVEEIEEAEEVAEVGEVEEVEKLEEVEEVEEIEEAEEVAEVGEVEEEEKLEEVEEVEEVEEIEDLEELEGVKEIIPLPLEPQEKLEELPPAEAAPGAEPVTHEPVGEKAERLTPAAASGAPIGEEAVVPLGVDKGGEWFAEDQELQRLLEEGVIKVYSIPDIENIIAEQRASVVMEDGVYRIKEEVFAKKETKADSGLKALAQVVLDKVVEEKSSPESGIGELLGKEATLDLLTEIGELTQEKPDDTFFVQKEGIKIKFYEKGLDYDGYLSKFKNADTDTGKMISLVELSRKMKAVCAAIFILTENIYSIKLKVGLFDQENLYFLSGEPFYERFIKDRKAVIINEKIENIRALAKKFNSEDLRYLQRAFFLPSLYQEQEAILFLGLSTKKDWNIKEFIVDLGIF